MPPAAAARSATARASAAAPRISASARTFAAAVRSRSCGSLSAAAWRRAVASSDMRPSSAGLRSTWPMMPIRRDMTRRVWARSGRLPKGKTGTHIRACLPQRTYNVSARNRASAGSRGTSRVRSTVRWRNWQWITHESIAAPPRWRACCTSRIASGGSASAAANSFSALPPRLLFGDLIVVVMPQAL